MASQNNGLIKVIDSQLTLGKRGNCDDLGRCFEANFCVASSVDGVKPLLVNLEINLTCTAVVF